MFDLKNSLPFFLILDQAEHYNRISRWDAFVEVINFVKISLTIMQVKILQQHIERSEETNEVSMISLLGIDKYSFDFPITDTQNSFVIQTYVALLTFYCFKRT